MKRTLTANIDGQVFNIDEDAYNLLQNYLMQLHETFAGNEGNEIVGDIESRIRELFGERVSSGACVMSISDVSSVITTLGRPEDLTGADTANEKNTPPPFSVPAESSPSKKKIYRNMQNKVFGGVLGGLAAYLGWNANIMRLLMVVLVFLPWTKAWPFIIIYLLAWMIIPAAVNSAQQLRMHGKPVTPDNMGHVVVAEATGHPDDNNFWSLFLSVCGKVIIGFIGLVASLVGFAGLIAFMVILTGAIVFWSGGTPAIVHAGAPWMMDNAVSNLGIATGMVWMLLAVLVGVALTWLACCVIFGVRGASRSTLIIGAVMAILLCVAAACLTAACTAVI